MRVWTLALLMLTVGAVPSPERRYKGVAQANLWFTCAMYRALSGPDRRANVFFSPLGIHALAALAYMGARGKTQREMSHGLGLSPDLPSVASGFRDLLRTLLADNNTTLHIATSIYLTASFRARSEYSELARDNFRAEFRSLDFHSEDAANVINRWVAGKTHGTITEVVTPDSLSRVSRLVMLSAVYFKGLWADTFDRAKTKTATFYVGKHHQIQVPMMSAQGHYKYRRISSLGAKILVLPYRGGLRSMVVLLPLEPDGLAFLEDNLRLEELDKIIEDLQESRVDVKLPRFKMDRTTELAGAFGTLGMAGMFGGNTDFSGMTDGAVKVSSARHRAFIDVNEEGTEASAVTKVIDFLHAHGEPPIFVADHPFIFFLRCEKSRTILFMGRLTRP